MRYHHALRDTLGQYSWKRAMEEQIALRVAVIGCGQIASIHLSHLLRLKLSRVVAVCDLAREQAVKMARSFNIPKVYGDLGEMLSLERPDVVHVLTPPASHAALTVQCLKAGAHVLVEKPMALSVEEADRMIAAAHEAGKMLSVDHNRLFSPPALEARRCLEAGELGELVSVVFFQGYGLPPGVPASWLQNQWFAKLPGGLIQDLAPHGLSVLLEFLGPPKRMHVLAKSTGRMPLAPADEVHIIMEGERLLGTYTISLGSQPFMNYFSLCGTKMTVRVNIDNFTIMKKRDRFPHPLLQRALGGVDEGMQLATGSLRNAFRFAIKKLPRYPDIGELLRRFYASLQDGSEPPVAMDQGREVIRLVQEVVKAIQGSAPKPAPGAMRAAVYASAQPASILITGATGLIGGALARRLVSRGTPARVLARPSPRVEELEELGVEVVQGDLSNERALTTALRGIRVVYHCAARVGSYGTWEEFLRANVHGTENILKAAHTEGARRFVYLSSLAVFGLPANGNCVTEATPYDTAPAKRGYYSHTKILAEKLVRKFAAENNLAVTIFRPGLVFGKGRPLPTAPLAFRFGRKFMVIGSGRCLLSLNYLENLVDALLLLCGREQYGNSDYNIVDDESLTSSEYHRLRGEIDGTSAMFIPSLPFRAAAPLIELVASCRREGKLASFSSHALSRVLRSARYDTHLVREQLGWCPRVRLQDALKEILS